MRKSDLKKTHVPLDAAISRYRGFMQRVIDAQQVVSSAQEKRDVAESVLLRLCANWERFVDAHIVDCVNCDPAKLSEHFGVSIPPHPSWDLCHALIIGDSYTDFRSFGDLKGFTKRILLEDSNPFLAVSSVHGKRIDEIYKIRNYLSHYSAKARDSLHKMYKSKYEMTRFLEPGYFVLGYGATRLWNYFDAFAGASAAMLAWCEL